MKKLIQPFQRAYEVLDQWGMQYYNAPFRAALARAKRDEDDLFMLLVFAETMGIPNPVAWYTLELQPILLERFHDWHVRMGMERSPLDHMRCC
ncbi:MAG TPA: DNA helicase [Candidatus Paenalcaligenes intestinipullorum]|uniref:DNA helicase n=1 Tax=Candidatus Paenalcaligenes intestinipullorum TaxID=2838718 RepID=A0A9D2U9N4_9BURK|nr:DNA helicase [Candidatus Paenalcaligenes intestinipullorum]